MKMGITTWSFESLSLVDSVALCRALGFERVDIAGFHNRGRCSLEPDDVGREPEKYADLLLRTLEPYGMAVADFFPQFGAALQLRSLNDPNPEIRQLNRETMKGIVKFCKLANIPGISLSPGVDHPEVETGKNLETSAREFKYLAELGGQDGITIRAEPHMHAITDTPEKTLYVLEQAPGTKVTLDYAHFMLQYISMERIHKLLPYTDHIHVRQARMGKMQTRTEEGTIDYKDVYERLKPFGFDGVFSVEYVNMEWFDCNQVDCITESLKTKAVLESI